MRPSRRSARFAVAALAAAALLATAGCVYRMPIQQGNYLDPAQVDQLETGMTRSQVSFLLGTPMVPSGFDNDRWDYYYNLKISQLKAPVSQRLTVYFENDKVSRIERPPGTESAKAPTPVDKIG
jgi:outer membrane protein assembly factor BamE